MQAPAVAYIGKYVLPKIARAADNSCGLDPLIHGGQEGGLLRSARGPAHADARLIDFGERFEVIERSHAAPDLAREMRNAQRQVFIMIVGWRKNDIAHFCESEAARLNDGVGISVRPVAIRAKNDRRRPL